MAWYNPGQYLPNDLDVVWCRIKSFYAAPILCQYDQTTQIFTTVDSGLEIPAYMVCRWKSNYGPELVENATFASADGWTLAPYWWVADSHLYIGSNQYPSTQEIDGLEIGKTYLLTVNLDYYNYGSVQFTIDNIEVLDVSGTGIATVEFTYTGDSNVLSIAIPDWTDCTFSLVSIREIL